MCSRHLATAQANQHLEVVFECNKFRFLGQKRKSVPPGTEDRPVLSPQFFLRLLRVDTNIHCPAAIRRVWLYSKRLACLSEPDVKACRD